MRVLTLPPETPDRLVAGSLAVQAGLLAARMRADRLIGESKSNVADIVTEADRAAEALVVGGLRQARPADGVLGEEGAAAEGTSGRRWIIDPVDGTYNFLSGAGPWCSALALETGGEPVSAVFVPGTRELFTADDGVARCEVIPEGPAEAGLTRGGSAEASSGTPDAVRGGAARVLEGTVAAGPLAQLSLATYLHPTWMRDEAVRAVWHEVAASAATVRMFGSGSVDLAYVADGRIGAWMQHSVPEWDWQPGRALVEAAGGVTAQAAAGGVVWSLAGGRQAVEEMTRLLGA
ncbi:inositol monophosphatase family protein [Falsarthrobacter nasiphocae]|uniref:Fructose-1,6-bisphosphatase/inositol monophosphatase family enzyme n=1 Tax=Falsarthrobacter nasiphocae TaxID=189863 RepID=A0AAE3YGG8_9MICC|nr:inositol monophosphatase family protein [Falsarthrobacter nasiphocae]MDR6891724.1 fructose-1,6-bisphosphatase/inositol monophosphatase family enzyme [Falsarthrobacter nasiphocae]